MTAIDSFFRRPIETEPDPRLREWKRRLERPGASATLSLTAPQELFSSDPEMLVSFNDGVEPSSATALWDDDLNRGLIELGVRAVDPRQEASRTALTLRSALRKVERGVGDGYFNAVLVDLLRESRLDEEPEIADVLEAIPSEPPLRDGKYDASRDRIADEISRRAQELRGPLRYPEDEAKRILVDAIARFIDRRFSVSVRRRRGWL